MKKALGFLLVMILLVRAWVYFSSVPGTVEKRESNFTAAQSGSRIVLHKDRTEPHALSVAEGASVEWTNESGQTLKLSSDDRAFGKPEIQSGETYSWDAKAAGVLRYSVGKDGGAAGEVVVLEEGEELFGGRTTTQEFQDSCSGCHGPNRRGGTGPALLPERLTEPDTFYFNTIKEGRSGTVMPAWGEQGLSEKEIWMLVGYIHSQPSEESQTWEMDDIKASREVLVKEENLPAAPNHNAAIDNLMLVTEREARSIAVLDGDRHELLTHIDASYRAHGYVFHPTQKRWAYNMGRDGWLFKIDLYSMQPVMKVRVGQDSRGLAISDDGKYIIAGNYIPSTAVILDAKSLTPLKVLHTEGENPDGKVVESRVCITSDVAPQKVGPYFIIALKEAGQVWRIDYSQPDFPVKKAKNVGRTLHDGFLSPDNSRFYIASQDDNQMVVIDVEKMQVVDSIQSGDTPHPGSGATWSINGQEYGATVHAGEGLVSIWNLATNEIEAELQTSGPGLFIRSHKANPYVWADTVFADTPNQTYIIDKETFKIVHIIKEGTQTLHPEFTKDGSAVYISDWQENVVRVYDGYTFEKIAQVSGVETPTGIFNVHRRGETLGH